MDSDRPPEADQGVVNSPLDASTGCAGVLDEPNAGCGQVASSDEAASQEARRPTTIREFERALRGLGFSQRESAAIARDGFKALRGPTGSEFDQIKEMLLGIADQLKKD